MGARPCEVCGELRKDGTISTPDGLTSPPCWSCGAPATLERPDGTLEPLEPAP